MLYEDLVVKQAVEQLHGQQVTQAALKQFRDTVGSSKLRAMRKQLQNKVMSRFPPHEVGEALAKVRTICLTLPETTERLSHGGPAFFIRNKKCFVMFLDDHHGDGRLAIWCAAPDGVQEDLVETDPERFFRPPYVGHLGWLGVQLPGIEEAELNAICREAFATVAPPSVLRRWRLESGG